MQERGREHKGGGWLDRGQPRQGRSVLQGDCAAKECSSWTAKTEEDAAEEETQ